MLTLKTANILSIRRFIFASSLAILPLAISSAPYVQAAENDNQEVTATVKGVLRINAPNTTSFNADSNSASAKSFDVNVRSNQKNGYEIKVYSANGGMLKNDDQSAEFAYTLSATSGAGTKYTEVTPGTDIDSASVLYSSLNFQKEKCVSSAGCDIGVSLNYDISNLELPADDYKDTITYEVLAK